MENELKTLSDKRVKTSIAQAFYEPYVYLPQNVKEFIKTFIDEDLDWLWKIHPKIYDKIVSDLKERAGGELVK